MSFSAMSASGNDLFLRLNNLLVTQVRGENKDGHGLGIGFRGFSKTEPGAA
jgi:hypothetical protein